MRYGLSCKHPLVEVPMVGSPDLRDFAILATQRRPPLDLITTVTFPDLAILPRPYDTARTPFSQSVALGQARARGYSLSMEDVTHGVGGFGANRQCPRGSGGRDQYRRDGEPCRSPRRMGYSASGRSEWRVKPAQARASQIEGRPDNVNHHDEPAEYVRSDRHRGRSPRSEPAPVGVGTPINKGWATTTRHAAPRSTARPAADQLRQVEPVD
jgi:hypothetical protein